MQTEASHRSLATRRLIHIVAASEWDSAWRYSLDICSHFRRRGWSVTAYTRDARIIDERFESAGIDLRHAPLCDTPDASSILRLASDFRREVGGAIVHVQRYADAETVLLARKLAGRKDIRVVSTLHTVGPGRDSRLMRRVYRNLDAQIFVSNTASDRFMSTWRGKELPFPSSRLHVMRTAVNMDAVTPVTEPSKGPRIAMYHGVLRPGRGLEALIDAMVSLRGKKLRLRIVGDGDTDYIDLLRRRAQVRGVMDLIDWKLRPGDVSGLIDDCHFGVLPLTEPVALGVSNIEYMAHGRPQVITGIGAPPEYITSGCEGIIVPLFDSVALSSAMQRLATDDTLRLDMGRAARKKYSGDMAWSLFSTNLENLYLSL